jgi:uncharacterized phage-associated protein
MENPISIANFFIEKAISSGKPLTNMQAVKLTYIAHGWYLGLTGQPLLDELAQAWKFGPVVPSVYEKFKLCGRNPITAPASQALNSDTVNSYSLSNDELVPFLDKIWETYGKYSGSALSDMTHRPGTPWDEVYNRQGGKENRDVYIPNDLIERHYKLLVERNLQPA